MAGNTRETRLDRDAINEADIRGALSGILDSEEFSRSKRMGHFLHFVVEEALAGRGERLTAFAIAREVYGRDESFDARSDAVVRVEAGRLRRRLSVYYEGAGRDSAVRIDLPKGGYPVVGPSCQPRFLRSLLRF